MSFECGARCRFKFPGLWEVPKTVVSADGSSPVRKPPLRCGSCNDHSAARHLCLISVWRGLGFLPQRFTFTADPLEQGALLTRFVRQPCLRQVFYLFLPLLLRGTILPGLPPRVSEEEVLLVDDCSRPSAFQGGFWLQCAGRSLWAEVSPSHLVFDCLLFGLAAWRCLSAAPSVTRGPW